MKQIERTLPWEDNDAGLIYGQCHGDDDPSPFIADVCESPLEYTAEERARAKFITRACNSHPQLLGALRELERVLPPTNAWQLNEAQLSTVCMRVVNAWNVFAGPVLRQVSARELDAKGDR